MRLMCYDLSNFDRAFWSKLVVGQVQKSYLVHLLEGFTQDFDMGIGKFGTRKGQFL